jgi:hypothetical protein
MSSRGTGGTSDGGSGLGGGGGCLPVAESDFAASPSLPAQADDFSSPTTTLSRWGARFFVVNEAGYTGSPPCSAELCAGALRLTPGAPGSSAGYFWHSSFGATQDQTGPIVYQRISGDFGFEVTVAIVPNGDPTDLYSGAGIALRNPNAFNHYVHYGLGKGDSDAIVTVGRYRYPSGSAGGGQTIVVESATPAAVTSGRLLLCRIGNSFSFHRRLTGEAAGSTDGTTSLDPGFTDVAEVEAGLSVHWFHGFEASFDGVFHDVRVHPGPATHQACRALLDD